MSTDSDLVLQLGRDLAEALDHSDIVGRWMSHHLAELISRCEASPEDKELASTTRNVVLKLWEHKSGAPFQAEPYAYLRPVLRAIERLDPSPAPWAFYRPFAEQAPSDKTLATYPLLQKACEIDREIGQLIRLLVGLTARDAISCEESWVMAGKDTANTEEDRAVRTLEQFVRRLEYKAEEDTEETSVLDSQAIGESDQENSSVHATDEESQGWSKETGNITEAIKTLNSTDLLSLAVQGAVVRCRPLLDQVADLCAKEPATDSELIGQTEFMARED